MPRARLVEAVWGEDAPESNALKVHLHNLRKSLVNANANIEVKAIASTGFCLVIKPEQATNVDKENQFSQTNNQGADEW